jgi:hypothetical protein
MKKNFAVLMMLLVVLLPASFVSCDDAEDGEDWDTWVMRNMLDSKWSLESVKVDGVFRSMGEEGFDFYYDMDLKASGRTFKAHRFFYKDNVKDESTEVNKSGTYTIDEKNKTIEATDTDGNKFFRLSDIEFSTGSMSATITFYDLNQTYEVTLARSL